MLKIQLPDFILKNKKKRVKKSPETYFSSAVAQT